MRLGEAVGFEGGGVTTEDGVCRNRDHDGAIKI